MQGRQAEVEVGPRRWTTRWSRSTRRFPRISPELVLVDLELARRVRHRIPRKLPGHRPPLPVLRLPSAPTHDGNAAHPAAP
jgi:hypothetical protein